MNILQEELEKSCISEAFSKHFISLSPSACWEYLLYGLSEKERKNNGQLRDKWLRSYGFLDGGGWWASGLDIVTLKDSLWGCLKPNTPREFDGKPIKYEHPPNVPTEAFFFGGADYWKKVLSDPKQPIIITEGAKKTASLLSAGFCAVGLPGIFGGFRSPKDDQGRKIGESYLIPQLKAISHKGREIIFCFDNDQKPKTIRNVRIAVDRTAKLLRADGCKVSVMHWGEEFPELKGIDDVHYHHGPDALDHLFRNRCSVTAWKKLSKPEPKPAPKPAPQETNRPIEAKTTRPLKEPKPMTSSVYSGSKNLNSKELLDFVQNNISRRLRFDDLRSEILMDGEKLRFGTDIKFWFLDTFGESASKEDIYDSLTYEAQKRQFNPVKEYLEACRQSQKRTPIHNIASRYFGTTDPIYDRMVEMWLISAVARVFQPGCQADATLILQGGQGKGKSTWFKTLAGEWFNDSVKDLENKDSLLTLHSSWIVELSELDRITSKKQAGVIKHFLTQAEDSFRKPYGKEIEHHPRRAVFCGTVNPSRFLVDEENRRFWIVPLGESIELLNRELLREERDGIWGAAADAFFNGVKWEPTPEEKTRIKEVTKDFEDIDVWSEPIEHWIDHRPYVSVYEILTELFEMQPGQIQRRDEMRVARILARLGWHKETRKHIGGRNRRVKLNPAFVETGGGVFILREDYQPLTILDGKVGNVGRNEAPQGLETYQPTDQPQNRSVNGTASEPAQRSVITNLGKKVGKDAAQSQQGFYQPSNLVDQPPKSLPEKKKGFKFAIGEFVWWGTGRDTVQILEYPPIGPLTASKSYKCLTDKQGEQWIKESDLSPLQ